MGRNRFPATEVERLNLSDGDWIEIKKTLNNGDQKRLEASGMKPPHRDPLTREILTAVDWEVYELERALIFLTDWSLKDEKDNKVDISMAALKAMDVETFNEVNTAILIYVAKQAALKKGSRAAKVLEMTPTPQTVKTESPASNESPSDSTSA